MSDGDSVDVIVLIKAAPETGRKHGETVCVAGVDWQGRWHRLYPVPWRDLRPDQRFNRWDVIRVRWRKPSDDNREESKRIRSDTLEVVGRVSESGRHELASRALVSSIERELESGRTLALIRPQKPRFEIRRRSDVDLYKANRRLQGLLSQPDLLSASILQAEAAPFEFAYTFDHADRRRRHVLIDWETEATFFKWRAKYGEQEALKKMDLKWGEEIPERGVAFAMGTHRVRMFRKWLLSGVLQTHEVAQSSLLL